MRLLLTHLRGFSLVEVIIVSAILLMVFGGLFASFQYSLRLIADSRAKMTALALITDRLEYIRSLPYDDVGTVLGIPSGNIPQYRTLQRNGLILQERVLIEFVDDPADGLGGLDSNGILSDYKRVKIEFGWSIGDATSTFSIAGTIVPRSIETDAGGGTIRVNVFDASVQPLSNMSVRLFNASSTSPVDVTRLTGPTGQVLFTGAPAGSDYELFVFAPGYSSDQTYRATTSLPYPTTLPVSVLEGDVSTMNFQIDRLSTTTVRLVSDQVYGEVNEEFTDLSGFSTSTDVESVAGALRLLDMSGTYVTSGEAWLNPVQPMTLASWGVLRWGVELPASTYARLAFFASTSVSDILPDSVLPGNAAGFTSGLIDLRGLSVTDYDTLVPRITLGTADTTVTPEVQYLKLLYLESESILAGQSFNLVSTRSIGTDSVFAPVPKRSISTTTESDGARLLSQLEWGGYDLTVPGFGIRGICPNGEFVMSPGTVSTTTVVVGAASAHSLLAIVKNASGLVVPGATVIKRQGASNDVRRADWCGQAYFGGLSGSDTFILESGAVGYGTTTINPFVVNGTMVQVLNLPNI